MPILLKISYLDEMDHQGHYAHNRYHYLHEFQIHRLVPLIEDLVFAAFPLEVVTEVVEVDVGACVVVKVDKEARDGEKGHYFIKTLPLAPILLVEHLVFKDISKLELLMLIAPPSSFPSTTISAVICRDPLLFALLQLS